MRGKRIRRKADGNEHEDGSIGWKCRWDRWTTGHEREGVVELTFLLFSNLQKPGRGDKTNSNSTRT